MPYDNLSEFLSELQDGGELVRISVEVDPLLEISGITERVCRSSSSAPAIFFERVAGSPFPVVTNLLGSESRICRALGAASLDDIAKRIAGLLQPEIPAGFLDKLKLLPQLAQISKLPPRVVRSGACQQVVRLGRDVDLREFPFLQSFGQESSRALTQTQVFTRQPVTEQRDVGRTPIILKDSQTVRLPWSMHENSRRNYLEYSRKQQRMPVAVVLGGDPVCTYAAAAPLPGGIDPCLAAGFLRGEPLELVKCRTIDLEVPTGAEVVFEGYVDPAEAWEPAARWASPSGYYNVDAAAPLLHITAVTQRANPVFPAQIPGRASNEEYWLGKATERIFLPLLRLLLPEVVDCSLPRCASAQSLLCISIRKEYPLQARKVMSTLWGLAPLLFPKWIVVVDDHVNVQSLDDVWFHLSANVNPARDVIFHDGPGNSLDHSASVAGTGRSMGFDATRKSAAEGHSREWPEELTISKAVEEHLDARWGDYGLAPDHG